MKKGEKIKDFRSSNFNVTTGMNFIFVDEPRFVSMCKHWRNTHIKTIAQKGFIYSFWMVRQSLHITEIHNFNN